MKSGTIREIFWLLPVLSPLLPVVSRFSFVSTWKRSHFSLWFQSSGSMVKFSLEHVSVDRRQWYSKHIGKLVIFTCIFMTINLQKQNSMELLMEWISSMRGTLESLTTCFTTVVCIMLLFIHQFNIVFHLVRILTSLSIKMKVLNIFLHITPEGA